MRFIISYWLLIGIGILLNILFLLGQTMAIYWPVVSLATIYSARGAVGWNFSDYSSYTILLSAITLYGILGFLFLLRNRKHLTNQ